MRVLVVVYDFVSVNLNFILLLIRSLLLTSLNIRILKKIRILKEFIIGIKYIYFEKKEDFWKSFTIILEKSCECFE